MKPCFLFGPSTITFTTIRVSLSQTALCNACELTPQVPSIPSLAFEEAQKNMRVINILVDFTFLADIFKHFNTGYLDDMEFAVMDRVKVVKHYGTAWVRELSFVRQIFNNKKRSRLNSTLTIFF